MADETQIQLRLNLQGRVVIPAEVRRQMGISPGETLVARIEEGKLVMEKPQNILRRLRARYAHLSPDVCLAAELVDDRRREAARESRDERQKD